MLISRGAVNVLLRRAQQHWPANDCSVMQAIEEALCGRTAEVLENSLAFALDPSVLGPAFPIITETVAFLRDWAV